MRHHMCVSRPWVLLTFCHILEQRETHYNIHLYFFVPGLLEHKTMKTYKSRKECEKIRWCCQRKVFSLQIPPLCAAIHTNLFGDTVLWQFEGPKLIRILTTTSTTQISQGNKIKKERRIVVERKEYVKQVLVIYQTEEKKKGKREGKEKH